MKKWLKRIVVVIALGVFLFSIGSIIMIMLQYRRIETTYESLAEQFVTVLSETDLPNTQGNISDDLIGGDPAVSFETAPITVDFEALQAINPDITAWIYCEDTLINYPVLHGETNDTYLRHLYDHSYLISGSIFIEAANRRNFADANTIIYGHYMNNGTMFGILSGWEDQAFYEAHQVLWILTPDMDYKVEILGGYRTSAYSDTYTIFSESDKKLDAYIRERLERSLFTSHSEPEEGAKYVLFSTCDYAFSDARFVLHGKLVPVDSAGGVLKKDSYST